MSSKCWKVLKGCSVSPSVEDNERAQGRKSRGKEYKGGNASSLLSSEKEMIYTKILTGSL